MKTSYLFFFFLNFFTGFNLTAQNIDRLKENNGFRTIKLGSDIRNYSNFIKQTDSNSHLFSVWTDYDYILNPNDNKGFENLGSSQIYSIYLKVFSNKIYSIMINVEKNFEIIHGLKTTFGEPNMDAINADLMWWQTANGIRCEVTGRYLLETNMYIIYNDLSLESEKEIQNRKKIISQF